MAKGFTEVTITFKVENNMYRDYERVIDDVLNTLDDVATDIDVTEA